MKETILAAHALKKKILSDPLRPVYHFCVPFDLGFPADPNAMFYAAGRYHMMYLYESREDSYRWGHASSFDLLHWQIHPDALAPDETDGGIYSGGVCLKDGKAIVAYWALGKNGTQGGIRTAESEGPLFEVWRKRAGYALMATENGVTEREEEPRYIGCADPSNLFRVNGKYYMQLGNLCVLEKFRGDPSAKNYHGDWSELFVSEDTVTWKYIKRFYKRIPSGGTEESEDCMCPYFSELPNRDGTPSGKYLQLFISHNKGCQYYIGSFDEKAVEFYPERHGRLAQADNALFAPEGVRTPDGRLVILCWMRDNYDDDLERELEKGWSGVYCLPRELFLGEDGDLGVAPLAALNGLRYRPQPFDVFGEINPECAAHAEIVLRFPENYGGRAGVVLRSAKGEVRVYADAKSRELVFDATASEGGRKVRESVRYSAGEELRVFLDGCVADAFIGDRALTRQIFITQREIRVFASEEGVSGCAYEIAPTNAF